MRKRIVKRILNGSQIFSALIAVLTSAIVSLLFHGFHWLILLSAFLVIGAIVAIIILMDICSLFKRMEYNIKWGNKQKDPEKIYNEAVEFSMNEMGEWDMVSEKQPQIRSFEKGVMCKTIVVIVLILCAIVSSCFGVSSINMKTEEERSKASKEYWGQVQKNLNDISSQLQNNQDSLLLLIKGVESDVNEGFHDLNNRLKRMKSKQ